MRVCACANVWGLFAYVRKTSGSQHSCVCIVTILDTRGFSFVCLLMKRSLDHDWKLSKSEKRLKQSKGDVDEGWLLHSVGFALCV